MELYLRSTFQAKGNKIFSTTECPTVKSTQTLKKKKSLNITAYSSLNCHEKYLPNVKIVKKKPIVSSKAWVVYDTTGQMLHGHNENDSREIASLTKIMTCILVIEETLKNRRSFQEFTQVSEASCRIEGTKAGLSAKDTLKIFDLLYGLMLPSGNDAALALAEHIGKLQDNNLNPLQNFVNKMNQLAKQLNLEKTFFSNPHGLSNPNNRSTAKNIAILTSYGLKLPVFRRIVSTPTYECLVYSRYEVKKVVWTNTNKLLWKGFSGVKTGFTPSAGPCLCSCIEEKANRQVIIVLLGCSSMNKRWLEAYRLWKWARESLI